MRTNSPTLTPNSSNNPATSNFRLQPSYKLITACTNPFFLGAHSTTFLRTLSNAFSKSTKRMHSFVSFPRNFSRILRKINNARVVPFPDTQPNCVSSIATNPHIPFSSSLSTVFIAWSNNFTFLYAPQSITPFL